MKAWGWDNNGKTLVNFLVKITNFGHSWVINPPTPPSVYETLPPALCLAKVVLLSMLFICFYFLDIKSIAIPIEIF
jgi:hypothetical protein